MATTDWLGALLQAVGQGGNTYVGMKQQERDRAIEAEQRAQAKAERDRQFAMQDRAFETQQRQFDIARGDKLYETSTPETNFADNPAAMRLVELAGRPLNKGLAHTPGTATAPMVLPGQSVGLGAPPPPIGKSNDEFAPVPAPTPPPAGPMMSPVGGTTLGSVKDTATRPKTVQELAMEELQKAFGGTGDGPPNPMLVALTAKRAGITLPANPAKSTFVANVQGADLLGQTDSFGKVITEADKGKRYSVRRNERNEDEYVPLAAPATSTRLSYQTLAGPNGQPAVYAVSPDGSKQFVGYKSAKHQEIVFVDADGNQRVVSIAPTFVDVPPTEVSRGGDSATSTSSSAPVAAPDDSAPFTPPQSAGVGRNLGRVQQPEAVRSAIGELNAMNMAVDEALALGDKTGWEGVGGVWQGPAKAFAYKQFGVGNPEGNQLRIALNNIFADIAKQRGGAALTPAEIKILTSYLPPIDGNASPEFIQDALRGIQGFMRRKLASRPDAGSTSTPVEPLVGFEGYERVMGPDGVVRIVPKKKGGGE